MRETLLKLYQSQVLDNLVRTKKHYPIIHVDYSNLTGTLNQVASANIGGSETNTNSNQASNAAGALVDRARASMLNYGATAAQTANLTITGQPVIGADSVYQAYVDAVTKDPNIIMEAKGPLQRTAYHLTHDFQGETWYVPADKGAEFFQLYLITTVQRQPKVPVSLTIQTIVVDTIEVIQKSPTQSQLVIRLKDKILNDSGKLTVALEGIERRFTYQADPRVPRGQLTDRVLLNNDETVAPRLNGVELAGAMAGKDVMLDSDTFVPGFVSPVPNQLEAIRSQLELQRLQQLGR
jgi:hypothetical protein